jgi:hypothetical protein
MKDNSPVAFILLFTMPLPVTISFIYQSMYQTCGPDKVQDIIGECFQVPQSTLRPSILFSVR